MFYNYLKIALRNIARYKVYSFINIGGLTIGMVCSILILLWVQDEMSFDRFHKRADTICKMYLKIKLEDREMTIDNTFTAVGTDLKNIYPEIINSARMMRMDETVLKSNEENNIDSHQIFLEKNGIAVDPSFLQIFSFPIYKGNPKTVLKNPNSILLTEELAYKYFGTTEVIGKTITLNNKNSMIVTGVMKNVPQNSHLRFDFLVPLNYMKNLGWKLNDYNDTNCITYLQLNNPSAVHALNEKIQNEYDLSIPVQNIKFQHSIETLPRVHLYGMAFPPRIIFIYVFIGLAIGILLIACINFINLSTARSMIRVKEVGVRKVIGAGHKQLIRQFLCESMVIAFLALMISLMIILLILPLFNQITGKSIQIDFLNPHFILGAFGIVGVTGLLAGSYPALYLSGFSPIHILKGTTSILYKNQSKRSKALFRKILVVTQFVLTIILLVDIFNGFRWDHHMNELGFDKDNVIYLRSRGELGKNYSNFKDNLLKNPNIEIVSTASSLPQSIFGGITEWGITPEQKGALACRTNVGYDFLDIFKLKMVEGRFFNKEFTAHENNTVIINEKAVNFLGLTDPIGKTFYAGRKKYTISGVIQDFHFVPKIFEIRPLILFLRPQNNDYVFIRLKIDENGQPLADVTQSIEYIRETHAKINPNYPFEYFFLNEFIFDEAKMILAAEKILISFTILGIFIAALGLFGLSSFLIEQRTKEIGIRKVLGASITTIQAMLSKQYLKLILIANIIAWPISFMIEQGQSQLYAYSIDFAWWLFVIAGGIILLVTFLAVGFQSYRASVTNPVETLRYE